MIVYTVYVTMVTYICIRSSLSPKMSTFQLGSMSFVYKNTTNSLFVINYIECMYNVLAKASAVLGLLKSA